MLRTFVFHGIGSCVTHLYVQSNGRQTGFIPTGGSRPVISGYYSENEDLGFFKCRKIIVGNQYERSVAGRKRPF